MSVHFPIAPDDVAQVVCTIPSRSSLTAEDCSNLWFQWSDFVLFKQTARAIARESSRRGFGSHLLENCIGQVNETRQHELNEWCLVHGYSRRGLERWSNISHREQRDRDQKHSIHNVLSLQEVMRLSGAVDADELSRCYDLCAHTARCFALMLGRADHYAAYHPHDGSNQLTRQQQVLRKFQSRIPNMIDEEHAPQRAGRDMAQFTSSIAQPSKILSPSSANVPDNTYFIPAYTGAASQTIRRGFLPDGQSRISQNKK